MKRYILLTLIIFLLAACSPSADTPTTRPERPTPGGKPDEVGPVFIDSSDLLIMESYPVQVSLHVTGNLPTPCHSFHYSYVIGTTNDANRIDVSVWSESDTSRMCTQVLEPFDESIPIDMSGAADGTYSVYMNGELVGNFSYPG
jgi:inhibitor of cysteine peptidase